jgi:hypothetical protein
MTPAATTYSVGYLATNLLSLWASDVNALSDE